MAAIYVRISADREGAGLGVARQEADCRPLAEQRGYDADHIRVYSDNDLSAYSGKPRPRYRDMLRDIESGDIGLVVAWHTDRLHRSVTELSVFIETVEKHGVDVETVKSGKLDLSTPTGRFIATTLGGIARLESEHKAERHLRAEKDLALKGKAHGGRRPFGFEVDRVTHRPDEVALIREAVQRALAGESVRSIAKDFDRRGIRTPDVTRNGTGVVSSPGQPWTISGLRKLLLSGRIAGRREHLGKDVGQAEWKPVISTEDAVNLGVVLTRKNRRGRGTGNRPTRYLLAGIAVCGVAKRDTGHACGARLVARPANGRRSYACVNEPRIGGCGRLRVVAEPLEALVVETMFQAVETGMLAGLIDTEPTNDAVALHSEIAAIDTKLAILTDKWTANELTDSEWERARESLASRRQGLVQELTKVQRQPAINALPDPLRTAWPTLDFSQRHAIVEAFIERIVIGPAHHGMPKFDPRRVTIKWRA